MSGPNGLDELDGLIERALVEEGTSMTPAPDAWERFRERLDDTSSAGGPPASRSWLLVAAAVVAGFGGLATALLMLTGGDGEVRTAEPSVDAADDASSGTTLDVVSEGARQPGSLLVATADGRLVRVDTDSGEVETLAGGADSGGDPIDNAAAGLDDTVLYSTCCEPAAGMTYRLEPDGESTFVSYGYNPTFSPDGLAFSLVQPDGITVHDLDGNVTRTIDAGDHYGNVMSVAWSPQGDRLAVEVANGSSETQILLLPVDAASLDEATPTRPDEGRWWAQPAFLADGTLLVAEHPQGQAAEAAGVSSVLREVTQDGRPAGTTDPGAPPYRLTADRTGTSAFLVGPDGGVVVRSPTGGWYWLIPPDDTVLTRAADIAW